ncbi:MAG: TolC family protein, partial [Myxococcota bacterium]
GPGGRASVFAVVSYSAVPRPRWRLAKTTLDQAKTRYVNGLSDYLPVLTALNNLQQLEQAQVAARRSLLSFRIQLYRALAGDWPAEIIGAQRQ